MNTAPTHLNLARSTIAATVTALALPLLPLQLAAQDGVLEEVIVTARKRAESLQETPLAVTALGAAALREAPRSHPPFSPPPHRSRVGRAGTWSLCFLYVRALCVSGLFVCPGSRISGLQYGCAGGWLRPSVCPLGARWALSD